jgi:hypothetical protein
MRVVARLAGRTAAEAGTDVEEGALPAVLAHIDGSELFLTHEYERHVKVDIPVSGGQFQLLQFAAAARARPRLAFGVPQGGAASAANSFCAAHSATYATSSPLLDASVVPSEGCDGCARAVALYPHATTFVTAAVQDEAIRGPLLARIEKCRQSYVTVAVRLPARNFSMR